MSWWSDNFQCYHALLFDIDGTLLAGRKALPGAVEMINWLREHNYPFYLLTNDGNHSTVEKSRLLAKGGVDIAPEEIVSCSMALNLLAEEDLFDDQPVFVMGDLGQPDYAEEAGLVATRDTKNIDDCQAVIIGEGVYDWQHNISAVINSLRRLPDRKIIVPNPDSYWPSGINGDIGIGAGGKARFMVGLLDEMGYQVPVTYLGKPYPLIFEYTLEPLKKRFSLPASTPHKQIMMLGDSLKSDIRGANQYGLTSTLMLSGITGLEHIKKPGISSIEIPDFVFQSIL